MLIVKDKFKKLINTFLYHISFSMNTVVCIELPFHIFLIELVVIESWKPKSYAVMLTLGTIYRFPIWQKMIAERIRY